jgi:hypothetical protein
MQIKKSYLCSDECVPPRRIAKMKNRIIGLAITAMALLCTPLLVSCGGDDDDSSTNQETSTSSVDNVEPCFEWGASLEQVKNYMTGSSW